MVAVSVLMIVALYFYFGRTVSGKALRATAVNRLGARLVGIGTTQAGRLAFTLAAVMLGETVHGYHWIGGGLVLLGVSLAQGIVRLPIGQSRVQA